MFVLALIQDTVVIKPHELEHNVEPVCTNFHIPKFHKNCAGSETAAESATGESSCARIGLVHVRLRHRPRRSDLHSAWRGTGSCACQS